MTAQSKPQRSVAVGGDIRDSILVLGDNNVLEVALGEDAILRRLLDEGEVRMQRRPCPRTAPPPPFADHLDRRDELASVAAMAGHVNIHGPAGIGKTYVLLAAVAGRDAVYVDASERPLDDVLQAVCEELFDCQPPLVLTPERRRHELRDVVEEIALDGVRLSHQDAQRLLTEAPRCRYLVASRRRLLPQAASARIGGLPADAAEQLIAIELGRPLDQPERAGARRLIEILRGHPLRLRQAAGLAADTCIGLADLAGSLATEDPVLALSALVRTPLELEDRELLAELAAVRGVALGTDRIAQIAEDQHAPQRLAGLETRHLVQSHSPRYSLVGALADAPWGEDLDERRERTAVALAAWAQGSAPAAVLDEAPALLELLRWAREGGRHPTAQRLARALDRPLAMSRRWAAWLATLQAAREIAAAVGDVHAESWALHQLGTRAYALGSAEEGEALLEQALAGREAIGDEQGMAATRHNLEFIRGGGPGGPDDGGGDGSGRGPSRGRVAVAVLVAATLAVGGTVGAMGGDRPPEIPPVESPDPTSGDRQKPAREDSRGSDPGGKDPRGKNPTKQPPTDKPPTDKPPPSDPPPYEPPPYEPPPSEPPPYEPPPSEPPPYEPPPSEPPPSEPPPYEPPPSEPPPSEPPPSEPPPSEPTVPTGSAGYDQVQP
jgi:hypothetical protein